MSARKVRKTRRIREDRRLRLKILCAKEQKERKQEVETLSKRIIQNQPADIQKQTCGGGRGYTPDRDGRKRGRKGGGGRKTESWGSITYVLDGSKVGFFCFLLMGNDQKTPLKDLRRDPIQGGERTGFSRPSG